MPPEPLLYRIDAWTIGLVLFAGMLGIWEAMYVVGSRLRARARAAGVVEPDLGSIETAVGGLLALILAFSFTMAGERFQRRQDAIVEEAEEIDTVYLRCAVLDPPDVDSCRDKVRRYSDLRVDLFEARRDPGRLRAAIAGGEELQHALWDEVVPKIRAADTPSRALLLMSLNQMIDLHHKRIASIREIVPGPVTLVSLLLCLGWAGFVGYSHGLRSNRRRLAWIGFAALICLVVLVTLDLDRPSRGLIRPVHGHSIMLDVQRRLHADAPR